MEGLRNNKLAEDLLHLALAQGASDMHIEPDEQGVRVRIRVDGLLQQLCGLKTVSIFSMDRNTPRLDLTGIRRRDDIVTLVRERVEYNKRKKGIYEITNH